METGGDFMYSILIVEDEPVIRKGIASLVDFESLGISSVLEAENGEQAIAMIQEQAPDILLTDINMPKMDGITLAQLARAEFPQLRIIFLTGYDYVDYLLSAVKLGVDDYILKPVTKIEIESLLIKVVSKLNEEEKQRRLLELASKNTSQSESVHFEKLILEQLSNPELSLVELAKQLGFSSNYLSMLIKKELGKSFQEYVTEQRIQMAKRLLLSTDMKIYEIAEAVGIEDMNYFSYRFKSIVGVTPKKFRNGANV